MTSKTIGHLCYTTSSFVHNFKSIGEFKLELQSGNAQFRSKSATFCPRDIKSRQMTLKNNSAPLLYNVKPCASFQSHGWIQTGVTVRQCPIWVKIDYFFAPCYFEIWQMTLKNNRAPFQCYFKLCASFRSYEWIQIGVTVQKRPILVKIDIFSHVTSKFYGWHWKTIGHLS